MSSEQDTAQIIMEDNEIRDSSIYVSKHSFTVPLNVVGIPREQVSLRWFLKNSSEESIIRTRRQSRAVWCNHRIG